MRSFCFFFVLFNAFTGVFGAPSYGLIFKSYEVLASERTGLYLEEGKAIEVNKELTLDFDLKFNRAQVRYGYAFRIISGSSSLITFGLLTEGSLFPYPVLVIDNEITPITTRIDFDEWMNVSITISNKNKNIVLKYKDVNKIFPMKEKWENLKICFGKCIFPDFSTEEVPSMCLKNVKISRDGHLIRNWPLDTHYESVSYDVIKKAKATALNPKWVIDSYREWEKFLSTSFDNENRTQYAFDASKGILYFVPTDKMVIACQVASGKQDTLFVKNGKPVSKNTNQLIFDSNRNVLVSYNLERQLVSSFDFDSQIWDGNQLPEYMPAYWHHTANFQPENSSIVIFGGYGFHQYKNDLIRINLNNNTWNTNKLIAISPRYSAASVIVNDTLFIFSGEGNKIGKQEVVTQITTDLFAVDLKTLNVSLIWEKMGEPYGLPCGNMIYNPDESCFYVLVKENENNTSLLRLSKDEPVIDVFSTIPNVNLNGTYNFYTLMKPENQNKLYALFCRNYELVGSKKASTIDSYMISYPPVPFDQMQHPVNATPVNWKIILPIVLVLLLLLCFLLATRFKRLFTGHVKKRQTKQSVEKNVYQLKKYYQHTSKSITLLGLFNAKDAEGKDITSNFTQTLKNILIVITLNSGENSTGIQSTVIDYLLWPDKDPKSARNNRNVSINRLNTLLEEIGKVHIYNQNNFWKIKINDNTFCDYLTVLEFMLMPKNQIFDDKEQTSRLLELLSYGPLLPFANEEWIDPYKAAYSDFALDFLLGMLQDKNILIDISLQLRIANLIFLFDSLNEEALSVKCRLLYDQGKKSLARNTYSHFCKEYEMLLGEKYLVPFSKII